MQGARFAFKGPPHRHHNSLNPAGRSPIPNTSSIILSLLALQPRIRQSFKCADFPWLPRSRHCNVYVPVVNCSLTEWHESTQCSRQPKSQWGACKINIMGGDIPKSIHCFVLSLRDHFPRLIQNPLLHVASCSLNARMHECKQNQNRNFFASHGK